MISWNHYQRKVGYTSKLKAMSVAKLWQDETGEKGIVDLFIKPLPTTQLEILNNVNVSYMYFVFNVELSSAV